MHFRWLGFLVAFAMGATAAAADKKPEKTDKHAADRHMKEELGVNQYTTPGIETLLEALHQLRPIAYDKVARDIPESTPPNRAQLALSTGAVIADGFLAVVAEKQSRLEPIGRALLRHAKGLGVGDHVTERARGILELGARKDWPGVRSELIGAQRDVEQGMMALKDEEIAHLVALGGWWRGLEISATLIVESYSPDKAALLVQPRVLEYFADRVSTLNPSLKAQPVFVTIEANLREVRKVAVKDDGAPPTREDVKRLHELASATIAALSRAEE